MLKPKIIPEPKPGFTSLRKRARASVTGATVNVDGMGDQVTKAAFGSSKAERK